MNATGIVRRIDDLGRVVIPKEIRRSMRIKEGDPLEILVSDKDIVFRKYDPIDKEKWVIAKNVLRHLLKNDFKLENYNHEEMTTQGKRYTTYEVIREIKDNYDVIGYLLAPAGEYTDDELAAAVKIAREILES